MAMIRIRSGEYGGKSIIKLSFTQQRGDIVPVLYQQVDPAEAKIDNFISVWGDTVGYAAVPAR